MAMSKHANKMSNNRDTWLEKRRFLFINMLLGQAPEQRDDGTEDDDPNGYAVKSAGDEIWESHRS